MKRNISKQVTAAVLLCLLAVTGMPAEVHYVDLNSATPTPPYTNWATAAAAIQDAIDAAEPGDEIVVTNNCSLIGNRGRTGGGAFFSTMNFCIFMSNRSVYIGGGAFGRTLNDCILIGNSAGTDGGGASCQTLNHCTLVGNSAGRFAGGAIRDPDFQSTFDNCILYYNSSQFGAENYSGAVLNCCCTMPLPTTGLGNIANEPLFVDYVGGNLRLQSNSPCINAGNNAYVAELTDLDGNPRIAGGTVDIGAYEFQSPASTISYAWLQQFGLPTDGSTDSADSDRDGLNNWQEWQCGTDPTNVLSVLRLLAPQSDGTNVLLSWQSVSNRIYRLEQSTNLGGTVQFSPLATNIAGQAGMTTYTDTNVIGPRPCFYRVGVQ